MPNRLVDQLGDMGVIERIDDAAPPLVPDDQPDIHMGPHRNRGIIDKLTALTVLFTGTLSIALVIVTVLGL